MFDYQYVPQPDDFILSVSPAAGDAFVQFAKDIDIFTKTDVKIEEVAEGQKATFPNGVPSEEFLYFFEFLLWKLDAERKTTQWFKTLYHDSKARLHISCNGIHFLLDLVSGNGAYVDKARINISNLTLPYAFILKHTSGDKEKRRISLSRSHFSANNIDFSRTLRLDLQSTKRLMLVDDSHLSEAQIEYANWVRYSRTDESVRNTMTFPEYCALSADTRLSLAIDRE
jgi:hypothetical protein